MPREDTLWDRWPDPVADLKQRFSTSRWATAVARFRDWLPARPRRLRSARLERDWRRFAVVLFVLLTLDMLTTMYAVAAVGPAGEANPLIRWTIERGLVTYTAVNLAAAALAAVGFAALLRFLRSTPAPYDRYFELGVRVWLGALLAAGLLVFANNVAVIALGRSVVA